MSDFSNTAPVDNDANFFEFDPGPEAAAKAGNRDFSVPPAWYPMIVTSFEKTKSKAGNDMFKVGFSDTTGAAKSKYPFMFYQTISDKNLYIVGKFLENLGVPKNEKGVFQINPTTVVGKAVEVYLLPEVWEGTTRSKVDKVRPIAV